jgi:hypothetical protein
VSQYERNRRPSTAPSRLIQLFQVIHEVFEFDGQVCVFNNALFSCSDLFCAAKIARSCGPDGNKEKYLQVCLNIRSRKIGMENDQSFGRLIDDIAVFAPVDLIAVMTDFRILKM